VYPENEEQVKVVKAFLMSLEIKFESKSEKPQRLSEKYLGISNAEEAADLHRHIEELRNEWERDL